MLCSGFVSHSLQVDQPLLCEAPPLSHQDRFIEAAFLIKIVSDPLRQVIAGSYVDYFIEFLQLPIDFFLVIVVKTEKQHIKQ